MPDRYRLPYRAVAGRGLAALVLIATVSAAAVAAQQQNGRPAQQRNPQQGQQQASTNPQPVIPPVVQADIDRIAKALETANTGRDPAKEDQRAEANLKAQQDIAFWGRLVAYIAAFEATITAAGVALVALTLAATRRAAIAAEQAAVAALDSANAASREFITTHRPKIILREAIIGSVLEGEKINVLMVFANVGETWGKIIHSVIDLETVSMSTHHLLLVSSVEPFNEIGDLELAPGEARITNFSDLHKRPKSSEAPQWKESTFKLKLSAKMNAYGNPEPFEFYDPAIHLVGQFLYEDRQGLVRRTVFRRTLIPERQRFYRIEGEPDLDYAD